MRNSEIGIQLPSQCGVSGQVSFRLLHDHSTNAYRAVYTVSIGERVYVLHCFEKKSTQGIRTPKKEIDLIKQRLRRAKEMEAMYV